MAILVFIYIKISSNFILKVLTGVEAVRVLCMCVCVGFTSDVQRHSRENARLSLVSLIGHRTGGKEECRCLRGKN